MKFLRLALPALAFVAADCKHNLVRAVLIEIEVIDQSNGHVILEVFEVRRLPVSGILKGGLCPIDARDNEDIVSLRLGLDEEGSHECSGLGSVDLYGLEFAESDPRHQRFRDFVAYQFLRRQP